MQIIEKNIDELIPYEKNPRKNDHAVKYVAKSIEKFGFKVPCIVDKNNVIIAGHTRYKAAKSLGLSKVPCIVASDLTKDQIKAFRIADNKVAEQAEWDLDLLQEELNNIVDFDMSEFGFSDGELESLSEDYNEVVDDYYEEELPENPKSKKGDVYRLGNHFLMCGSSTDSNDVETLTNGQEIDLCVTDPPYNVNYGDKANMLNKYAKGHRNTNHIMNDNMDNDSFYQFLFDVYTQMLNVLKPGGSFYIWHAETEGINFRKALEDAGGIVRQCLIWNKNTLVLGRQDYHWKHEPCLYGWKDGAGHYFINDRTQTTVIEKPNDIDSMTKEELKDILKKMFDEYSSVFNEDKPTVNDIHPTMKPVKLIARLIKNSSKKKEKVIDFFGGSGSTLIACEQLNRTCYTMELDPKYVDVIIDRWEMFTGKKAEKIK